MQQAHALLAQLRTNQECDVDFIPNGQIINGIWFVACRLENSQVLNGGTADLDSGLNLDNLDSSDFSGCFFFHGDLVDFL